MIRILISMFRAVAIGLVIVGVIWLTGVVSSEHLLPVSLILVFLFGVGGIFWKKSPS